MDWDRFSLGFWHPTGAYCGRTVEHILDWKKSEVERHGWTFWSFVYTAAAEQVWFPELINHNGKVHVLCSYSRAAKDPKPSDEAPLAARFKKMGSSEWEPMPEKDRMYVTNPFKRKGLATAFIVKGVEIVERIPPPVQIAWYARGEKRWSENTLPARGEFLIKPAGKAALRSIVAILELQHPYLVTLTNLEPI